MLRNNSLFLKLLWVSFIMCSAPSTTFYKEVNILTVRCCSRGAQILYTVVIWRGTQPCSYNSQAKAKQRKAKCRRITLRNLPPINMFYLKLAIRPACRLSEPNVIQSSKCPTDAINNSLDIFGDLVKSFSVNTGPVDPDAFSQQNSSFVNFYMTIQLRILIYIRPCHLAWITRDKRYLLSRLKGVKCAGTSEPIEMTSPHYFADCNLTIIFLAIQRN